ncbi:hypothetical protein CRYUN_Cryun07bG0168900 [Craigia yunnanensis]
MTRHGESSDPRRFPGHREVLMYLKDFATEFGIEEMVWFETEVVSVGLEENGKWKVKSKERGELVAEEIFDAVVVCNGHNTEPHVADIPGIVFIVAYFLICPFTGKISSFQMSASLYSSEFKMEFSRVKNKFNSFRSSFCSIDISRDLAGIVKEVHFASRSVAGGTYKNKPGYMHHLPFLEANGVVNVDDNRVGPLYKHVIPFVMCELQSKWIAGILSGRIALPPLEEMMEDIEAFYSMLKSSGTPKAILITCFILRLTRPDEYRQVWDDQHPVLQAREDSKRATKYKA